MDKPVIGRVIEVRGEDRSCPVCGRRIPRNGHIHWGALYKAEGR